MHFEVVVYRLVSVCILKLSCIASYRCVFCSIDLTAGGAGSLHSRENPLRENPHVFTCIVSVSSAHQKQGIDTCIIVYQERSVLTVLTSIVHVSSARQERSRIGTYRACIEKVKSGVLRIGHVFMVFTRVSNGPNPACAESAGIVMYRACPNWGAGIHRYRKVSPVSCIEYVSRGPRLTHFFKTCEIHEIHARYQGNKMEEYRITIPVKKRAIHYDTWYWGKTDPILGGNPPAIHAKDVVDSGEWIRARFPPKMGSVFPQYQVS